MLFVCLGEFFVVPGDVVFVSVVDGVEVVTNLLCGRQGLLSFWWGGDVDEFYCFVEYVDFVAVECEVPVAAGLFESVGVVFCFCDGKWGCGLRVGVGCDLCTWCCSDDVGEFVAEVADEGEGCGDGVLVGLVVFVEGVEFDCPGFHFGVFLFLVCLIVAISSPSQHNEEGSGC